MYLLKVEISQCWEKRERTLIPIFSWVRSNLQYSFYAFFCNTPFATKKGCDRHCPKALLLFYSLKNKMLSEFLRIKKRNLFALKTSKAAKRKVAFADTF